MTHKPATGQNSKNSTRPGQKRLRETPLPPNLQQILLSGEQVAQLLNSDVFNQSYRSAVLEIQDEILQSNPEEKNKREVLYLEARSLNRVANRLLAMLNEAQHENEKLRAAEQSAQQANQAREMGIG